MDNDKIETRKVYSEIFEKIRKGYRQILVSICLCMTLGIVYLFLRTPSYDTYASVLITSDSSTPLNMVRQFSVGSILGGSGSVYNEQKMLSSHTTMQEVMKVTGLNISYFVKDNLFKNTVVYPEPPVKILFEGFDCDTLSSPIKVKLNVSREGTAEINVKWKGKLIGKSSGNLPVIVSTSLGEFKFDATSEFHAGQHLKESIIIKSYSAAAEDYLKKIEFDTPSKLADLITIYFKGKNKQLCLDLLQTVVDQYNLRGIDEYKLKESKTLQFINDRLETLLNEIYESERNIKDFKERNGIADVQADVEMSIERFGAIEAELLPLQSKYEIVEMTIDFLRNPQNIYEPMPVVSLDTEDTEMIKSYNDLIMERMRIIRSAKENNPSLVKMNESLQSMRENILQSLSHLSKNISIELKSLQSKNRQLSARLGSVPAQEVEFNDIRREQYLRSQTYNYLIQLQEETAMNILNTNGRGQLVDKPYISSYPTQKSTPVILIGAFLAGLLLMPVYWYIKILITENS